MTTNANKYLTKISDCESALGRKLSFGERVDLLMDNFADLLDYTMASRWATEFARQEQTR